MLFYVTPQRCAKVLRYAVAPSIAIAAEIPPVAGPKYPLPNHETRASSSRGAPALLTIHRIHNI